MPRQELEAYLSRVYPGSRLDANYTLGGKVRIRCELGAGNANGTQSRVQQAAHRATTLFKEAFPDPQSEIFVVIYDWHGQHLWTASSQDYLSLQFPAHRYAAFYKETVLMYTRSGTRDTSGIFVQDRSNADLVIGRLPIQEINVQNIMQGLAGLEMGAAPGIPQQVFFYHPSSDRGFQMYDDRGCYIWSDHPDKLREIYLRRKDWIPDFHKAEIAAYFEG